MGCSTSTIGSVLVMFEFFFLFKHSDVWGSFVDSVLLPLYPASGYVLQHYSQPTSLLSFSVVFGSHPHSHRLWEFHVLGYLLFVSKPACCFFPCCSTLLIVISWLFSFFKIMVIASIHVSNYWWTMILCLFFMLLVNFFDFKFYFYTFLIHLILLNIYKKVRHDSVNFSKWDKATYMLGRKEG